VNLFSAILITIAVTSVAIACMLLVRRRAPEGSYFQDGDRAAGVFGVLATGYAVFAGFVIFLAFTTYDQSRNGAETEALLVTQQFETAQFLPVTVRERLSGELVCYARTVVQQEWPGLEAGTEGDTLNPWGVALFRTLKIADPKTVPEQAAYSKWLDQTSDREEARRDRIHGAANVIPDSLWLVLLLSASVIFLFMLFFADSAEGHFTQAMMIGSVAAVLTVTLLVIRALDTPYHPGLGQLQPAAMERALVILEESRDVVGDQTPPPCDAIGMKSK
jgi:ABC-type multidrug transport system fused ATPase/permease subunit